MSTPHAEKVYEKYRQEGREQMLAFLVQKGVVRESMLGAYAANTFTDFEDRWHVIDLPKDLTAWQPKKEENNDR